MYLSGEIGGKIEDKAASSSRYGSINATINSIQSQQTSENNPTLPSVPPKPAVRQRTLHKQLNKAETESVSSNTQQSHPAVKESKVLDNEQANNQKNELEESIISSHYHAEVGRNNTSGNQYLTNKELASLPLPSNQQITANKDSTTRGYPFKVLFIVANEFCERFSFYGFKTILVLYFKTVLGYSDSSSTVFFHLFVSACYLTPILGSILGDSIWGRFKTVLYLSILYFVGEVLLTLSSVFWNFGALSSGLTFFALFMISIGTGGIKPCVSALGGDQFFDHEEKWRQSFYSLFYWAINLGSLISMFLTPMLRSDFKCVGRIDCYPLAFGIPCALMFVSIIVFLLAKNKYNIVPLPEQNVFVAFCKCVWFASKRKLFGYNILPENTEINKGLNNSKSNSNVSTISILEQESSSSSSSLVNSGEEILINSASQLSNNKQHQQVASIEKQRQHRIGRKNKKPKSNHWLYLASDRFDSKSIEDFKAILGLLFLFIPFPIYWCLYDQQGSLWTLQANRMDGRVFNTSFVLEPDQIGVVNPLLIITLIPIFEILIYPGLEKCGLLTKPIQRIIVGGLLLSLAFLTTGLIELRIQKFLPPTQPVPGQANLLLVNGLSECSIISPLISYDIKPSIIEESSNLTAIQKVNSIYMLSHTFDTLQPLNVQSLNLLSSNASYLSTYKLKFRLTSPATGNNMSSNLSQTSCPFSSTKEFEFNLNPLPDKSVRLLYLTQENGKLEYKMFNETLELPVAGKARVRLLYEAFGSSSQVNKRQFSLARLSTSINQNKISNKTSELVFKTRFKDGMVSLSDYLDFNVPTKGETFTLQTNDALLGMNQKNQNSKNIFLEPGTRNLIVVHQKDATNVEIKHDLLQDNDYRVSMLYQAVPYILLSAAEVMFSITQLEFCYAMAPLSMKSVVLGINSLTTSIGNVLTVALESMRLFSNVANEFFFYSTLMVLDVILLAIIGYYYKPNNNYGKANK